MIYFNAVVNYTFYFLYRFLEIYLINFYSATTIKGYPTLGSLYI